MDDGRLSTTRVTRHVSLVILIGVLAGGCATAVKEVHRHPKEAHLERLLATILPHTKYPSRHYWVRVTEPTKHRIGLAILPQRHIYLAAPLIEQVDDATLTALLAHGVAHHRLHLQAHRGAFNMVQNLLFKVAGFFIPGLSYGSHAVGPIAEVAFSQGQEPWADRKTLTYLSRMGRPAQDYLRALEFLAEQGYAERVGSVIIRNEDFTNRLAQLRQRTTAKPVPDPTE